MLFGVDERLGWYTRTNADKMHMPVDAKCWWEIEVRAWFIYIDCYFHFRVYKIDSFLFPFHIMAWWHAASLSLRLPKAYATRI